MRQRLVDAEVQLLTGAGTLFRRLIHFFREIIDHPSPKHRAFPAMLRSCFWGLRRVLTEQPRDLRYHGMKLRCYPWSSVARRIATFGTLPDYREMSFLKDYLRRDDCVIDVGANIGAYSLLARSLVGDAGRIDAFEVDQRARLSLVESTLMNRLTNLHVHPRAVGATSRVLEGDPSRQDELIHVRMDRLHWGKLNGMNVVRLDEALDERDYALLRVSLNGYEPLALRGATRWLRKGNPPVLMIDMQTSSKRYGVSLGQFLDELKALDYQTAVYAPEHRALCFTAKPWLSSGCTLIAIHQQAIPMVRNRLLGVDEGIDVSPSTESKPIHSGVAPL